MDGDLSVLLVPSVLYHLLAVAEDKERRKKKRGFKNDQCIYHQVSFQHFLMLQGFCNLVPLKFEEADDFWMAISLFCCTLLQYF